MKGFKDIVLPLIEAQGEASAKEIQGLFPGLPVQTVFSRIRALEKEGLVFQSGRGKYRMGTKPEYKVVISPRMKEVNAFLISECVGVNNCISDIGQGNVLVEASKRDAEQALVSLRAAFANVYSFKEAVSIRKDLRDAIIVKSLVTDSPILSFDGLGIPSLEKKLVDLVVDRDFFHLDDATLHKEFQRAFEVYPINRDRILRYAGRRNVRARVLEEIGKIDKYRVDIITTIQCTLAKQPVVRAWLFGSWSRMEERPDSDIDLLVDFDKEAHVSLLDHSGFMLNLEDVLNKSVDYITNGSLLPFAEKTANKDKYLIYERIA